MLNTLLKSTAIFFISIAVCTVCYADNEDSVKNKGLTKADKMTANKVVVKDANVIYPSLLEKQQEHFIAYVEKFSLSRKAYLQRTYARSQKFFPKATLILKKYNVPAEFAVLLALESAFNANAVSSAGAVGYWQMMDDVAKEFGLKIIEKQHKIITTKSNKKEDKTTVKLTARKKKPSMIDERKNFQKSTHAAARYLKDRMRNLNNDWLLVAASYNWGVGNVWNAMQRTGKTNPTFWDIKNYLPSETKSYVMNFIAINVIFKNYRNFKTNNLCFKDETDDVCIVAETAPSLGK